MKQKINGLEYPFVVFMQRKDLPTTFNVKNDFIACLNDVRNSEFYVCVHIVDDDVFTTDLKKTLYINDAFLKISTVRIASKVSLRLIEEIPAVKSLKLFSKQSDNQLIKKFKNYFAALLCEQQYVLLNANFTLQISENLAVNLEFEEKFCVVDSDFLENCQYSVGLSEDIAAGDADDNNHCEGYYEDVNADVEKDILLAVELNLRFDSSENVLIVGKKTFVYGFLLALLF